MAAKGSVDHPTAGLDGEGVAEVVRRVENGPDGIGRRCFLSRLGLAERHGCLMSRQYVSQDALRAYDLSEDALRALVEAHRVPANF